MTEIERIVEKGIVPIDFFVPETRCDFYVDVKRKHIWAIELDLLLELDRVCKKHDLTYYIAYGSLLGAVRHHGFIPWDDDLDVLMLREDYDSLWNHASEFRDPYFFQTPYTDQGYLYAHARLRNSRTTMIQRPFCFNEYNMGVFLDILPLDNFVPGDEGSSIFGQMSSLLVDLSTSMKISNLFPNERDATRIKNLSPMNPLDRFENVHRLAKSFAEADTDFLFPSAALTYGIERSIFYKHDFENVEYLEFEGFNLPVPSGYKHFLSYVYGDYMKFPPIEKRGIWHGDVWTDAEKSYKDIKKTQAYINWSHDNMY